MERFNLIVGNLCPKLQFLIFVSWSQISAADIIFAGQPMGPSSNIYAIATNDQISKLTDDTRWRDLMAHIGPAGAFVFTSNRKENSQIDFQGPSTFNIFTLEDGRLSKLTDDANMEAYPQFSPDGKRIAFIEHAANSSTLQVLNRNGSDRRILAQAQAISGFSWSPDGARIVYAMQDGDRSAVEMISLSAKQSSPPRSLVEYRTSVPDEQLDPATASSINGFSHIATSAQWSPDGNKIAYIVHSLQKPERVLRVLDLTSGIDRQISSTDVHVQQPVTWSPDSERLLYAALVDYEFYYDEERQEKIYEGGMHIFLATVKGQNRQITHGEHLHNRPVFSPDEKAIAFLYGSKLDSRALSVRVTTLDGKPTRELFHGVARDSFLYWTPTDDTKH
jgi:TolB protein